VQRFQSGDEGVLETLVRTLGPAIEGVLCSRFPLLRPYVEDLVVESLYRAWVRRKEYDPEKGSLYTWWLAIAQNAARDLLRAGWQQVRASEADLEDSWLQQVAGGRDPLPGEPPGQESPVELSAQERAFWEVLNGLPELDRRIVLYHAQVNGQGSWAADLSGEVGLSAGAIRVRRLRAMRRIQAELNGRGYATRRDEVEAYGTAS